MNQLDASLAILEKILTTQDMIMHEFDKRFFKLTLDTFKRSASENQETNKNIIDKFNSLCQKIQADNQLNEHDLPDLAADFTLFKKKQIESTTPANDVAASSKANKSAIAKKPEPIRSLTQNNKTKDQNGNYFC